jgi:hypothetical protein
MINYRELFKIFEFNNINKTSPADAVYGALDKLNYTEADKQEALRFLKTQGWMAGGDNEAVFGRPVEKASQPEVQPVSQNELPSAPVKEPIMQAGQFAPVGAQPESQYEPPATAEIQAEIQPENSRNGSIKKIVAINAIIFIVLVAAGFIFAYLQKIGPFAFSKYTEGNFFSGLLKKTSEIHSASYTFSGSLDVVGRDEDAKPFKLKEASNAAEMKKKYANDSTRAEDVASIIRQLNNVVDYYSYSDEKEAQTTSYPESIVGLFDNADSYSYYSYGGSNFIKDPVTGKNYDYQTTEGGKNFALTVTFETDAAITAINEYDYDYYGDGDEDKNKTKDTIIAGKTVTFTKESSTYIYMPSEPPKPFLVSLSDAMRTFPAEISISSSVSAASETNTDNSDWMFNVNAEGDFGDLTYKINADALKKEDTYYLKINNFPSLFLAGDLSLAKGKWVSITPKDSSEEDEDDDHSYSYSLLAILKENIADMEKSFKENSEKSVKFTKMAIGVADESRLISFKEKPREEKVDGRQLVRYDLRLNKDAILTFYTKLQEEIDKDPDFTDYRDSIDQGLIDYLKSDEFDEVYSYMDENDEFILWTDVKGYPAIVQNTMRIVPPDSATQLKDKQIDIVFKWEIGGINEALNIEAPVDSVSVDELIDDYNNNLDSSMLEDESDDSKESAVSELARLLQANIGYFFWK